MLRRRPAPTLSRSRAAAFGILLGAAAAVLAIPALPGQDSLSVDERAPHTITAVRDARYESPVLTAAKRDAEAANVPEVKTAPDATLSTAQIEALDRLLATIKSSRTGGTGLQQQLTPVAAAPGVGTLSTGTRTTLLSMEAQAYDAFARRAHDALTAILRAGVGKGDERTRAVDAYLQTAGNNPGDVREQGAFAELLRAFVVPNVDVDVAQTEANRNAARAAVAPVSAEWTRGQVIVAEGQTIGAAEIEALEATGVINRTLDPSRIGGGIVLALGLAFLFAVYLYLFQPFPDGSGGRVLLVGFVMVAAMAAARFALPQLTPDREQHHLAFALPIAAAALIVAGLADLPLAVLAAAATGLFAVFLGAVATNLPGSGFVDTVEVLELALAYTAAGLAGAAVIHRAERLSRYGVAAIAVAVATAVVLGAFWLINETRSNDELAWIALASGVAGLGSAMLAAGVFVVLSMFFGVTTRLQLMELGQSNHPLLRRLQDEAPGTYHHSMMVGALAERAADRVGADALITRTGAYYHDIGKLLNPICFIENQLEGSGSPHDHLPPEESARLIRAHVTDGLEIARRYHLPSVIRDFIPQHHGTRLVTFFYRRAAEKGTPVDSTPFQYVGPRPQTKESAIVMLADSCEAIVRANGARTQSEIEALVDGIFAERLAEGQLDETDITMRDLQLVAESFKVTLRAVYHPRIVYPSPAPEELARIAGN